MDVERGAADELPDWIGVIFGADRLGAKAMDLVSTPIPNRTWLWWALLLNEAEARAREMASPNRNTGTSKGAIGAPR